ncbi:DUF937 domain-containing protein [Bradyrhizobium sp. Tv2a-2]|uniref:DUF937 domain-containing protein n=1 Tax=Bradyrhizobium sp. Tv2a-2 TaxID=113395 RepID=UPI0004642B45|nr:DUF937 domain-containing protein [Bradyrhizobium sp. Tv2a-2]
MAANLTSVVMQFLTPEIIEKIASFLGLDRALTQKAAGGAVPALLAGLSDLVGTPSGTSQLSKLLSQQGGPPADLLRNIGPQGLAETGTNMLSGLFGGRTMDAMAQAVGKFAGTSDTGAKSLLGILAPMVLGGLGQHQRSAGLDATGLASLLRSQKDQITAAIPSGLADQLGAAGLIDRAETALRSGTAAASAGASRIESASQRAGTFASRTGQLPYLLAAAIILAGIAWYAIERRGQETVAEVPAKTQPARETVGMAPAQLTVDGVNLASQLNSSISTLKSALPGMTDATAAQAALPKINEAIAQLNDLTTRVTKLSPDGRSAFAKMIVLVTPSVKEMCDKVMATPGVGPIAKPAIDDLRAKMDSLSQV